MMTPPEARTGSAMKAPTLSGPSSRIFILQVRDLFVAECLDAHALGTAVGMDRRQQVNQPGLEIHVVLVPHLAGTGRTQIGAAVIGIRTRNYMFFFSPSQAIIEVHHEAQRRVHRGRSAGREEHMVQIARRQFGQLLRQFRRRHIAQAPGAVIGHAHDLLSDRLGHFLAAMADIDAPHAGRPVDQLVAVAVMQIDAFGLRDDRAFGRGQRFQVLPGMDPVAVLLVQLFGIERQVRAHVSCSFGTGGIRSPARASLACAADCRKDARRRGIV